MNHGSGITPPRHPPTELTALEPSHVASNLKCEKCTYALLGLPRVQGHVKCPECGSLTVAPPEGVPFHVVCAGQDGSYVRIRVIAPNVEAAARIAREQGHVVIEQTLRAPPMLCRRCHYVLTGLEAFGPDYMVRCPECGTLSIVPAPSLNEIYTQPEPGIVLRGYAPGAALAVVGVIFAVVGVWFTYVAVAAIVMGAFACDRSAGRRGWFAMGLGAAAFVVSLAWRAIR